MRTMLYYLFDSLAFGNPPSLQSLKSALPLLPYILLFAAGLACQRVGDRVE